MRIRDLSIRGKLFSLIGGFALGFAAFLAIMTRTSQLERASTASVIVMKDLVADVLPPPKYIIESYLTLLQLSYEADPAAQGELIKTWERLKKEFDDRQTYWEGIALDDPRLKQALVKDSTTPAHEFFALADKDYLPAVRAGDHAKLTALLTGKLRDAYQKHRASIDDVVAAANKQSEIYARAAVDTVDAGKVRTWTIGVGILGICIAFGWIVSRSISRRIKSTVEALDAVAAGDLSRRLVDDSNDDLGKMSRALNAAVDGMSHALGEVQAVSQTLTGAAGELSASAESIASGAHEQAASLQETAASLEQITATMRQSSDNAQEASQLASGSRQSAERGGTVVTQANVAMTEIHDASDRISNIITTIDEIAFQTNILALNAAVEAARAGEQGRGFAVVAAQVGTLAQRSSDAAKEIKSLIQDSVKKVASGSALVSRSGQSLAEILKSVTCVTDLVAEMAAAFREQSTGLDQISQAVAQMDEVMQSSSSQTETLSGTATRLTEHAERLYDLLGRFRLNASAAPPARQLAEVRPSSAAAVEHARKAPARRPTPARFKRAAPIPYIEPKASHAVKSTTAAAAPVLGPVQTEPARTSPAPGSRVEPDRGPTIVRDTTATKPAGALDDPGIAAMDEAMVAAASAKGTRETLERAFEEV
jgi:methyl-accepting chemotaxis protein